VLRFISVATFKINFQYMALLLALATIIQLQRKLKNSEQRKCKFSI